MRPWFSCCPSFPRLIDSQCDGKAPACTQCLLRGRDCPGQQHDFIFLPRENPRLAALSYQSSHQGTGGLAASKTAEESQSQRVPRFPSSDIFALSHLQSAGLEKIISLIAQHYLPDEELSFIPPGIDTSQSRICGCWVEVLPAIVADRKKEDVIVPSAIRALCVSILSKDTRKRGLNPDATEAYCVALALLRKGLPTSHAFLYAGFTAASMCLTLAEVR